MNPRFINNQKEMIEDNQKAKILSTKLKANSLKQESQLKVCLLVGTQNAISVSL